MVIRFSRHLNFAIFKKSRNCRDTKNKCREHRMARKLSDTLQVNSEVNFEDVNFRIFIIFETNLRSLIGGNCHVKKSFLIQKRKINKSDLKCKIFKKKKPRNLSVAKYMNVKVSCTGNKVV